MEMNDLRRAAAANLAALRDGTVARREAEKRAARKRAREADTAAAAFNRARERDRKATMRQLRERLREIEGIERCVKVDYPADIQRGALEELDAERDSILERLERLR